MEASRANNAQPPPPSPTIPTLKKSSEEWSATSLQEYGDTQMEEVEENSEDAVSHTDTDSGSECSKKRERDYFKTPYPVKPKRENKEKILKQEIKNLKASKKKEVEEIAEMVQEKTVTIKELMEKLAENENKLAEKDNLIAEKENELAVRENVRNNPQEEAWRKRINDHAVQILQKEKHYPYYLDEGVLKHPHHRRVKKELGSFHPKETSLNLEWSHEGSWQKCPKIATNKNGPNYFNFWVGRVEPYIDINGELKRAFAYGDSNVSLYLWYSIDEMQEVMDWVIPEISPWENLEVWDNDRRSTANPDVNQSTTGSAPRGSVRGNPTRGRSLRGRTYPQRGRGRSQQTYRRDNSRGRYNYPEFDRNFESPDWYSSGPGRSSGGVRDHRRDSPQRPGQRESRDPRDSREYRYRREESRDRRDFLRSRRGRDTYEQRHDEHYSDESSGRDNRGEDRRDYGSGRARSYGYRNS